MTVRDKRAKDMFGYRFLIGEDTSEILRFLDQKIKTKDP